MEWGPWIEHDGKGCPCRGMWAEAVVATLPDMTHTYQRETLVNGGPQWLWENAQRVSRETETHRYVIGGVIRYRIRKPRGLTILEELIADLPAPVGPKVDA